MLDSRVWDRSQMGIGADGAEWEQLLVEQASVHHLFRSRRIGVAADEGVVTLHGEVQSYYEKQLAQEVVRKLDGVVRVENELEVAYA